jgi:hypothetical protein
MLTKLKIDGNLGAKSILKININSNLLIKKVMEAMVGIGLLVLIVVVVFLFFKNKSLKEENTYLKEDLKESESLIAEELTALETFGQYYVDGNSEPLEFEGFTVVSHRKNGLWKWNPNTSFYLSEKQKDKNNETHGTIKGCQLYQEIAKQDVLNGNTLDFLLTHQTLIPRDWPFPLPFWGTVYRRNSDGQCFVRCLVYYLSDSYGSKLDWLGAYFGPEQPAILDK